MISESDKSRFIIQDSRKYTKAYCWKMKRKHANMMFTVLGWYYWKWFPLTCRWPTHSNTFANSSIKGSKIFWLTWLKTKSFVIFFKSHWMMTLRADGRLKTCKIISFSKSRVQIIKVFSWSQNLPCLWRRCMMSCIRR